MRVAVVDCGTNTFNLLIGEPHLHGFYTIFSDKISVKIGKGGIHNSMITHDAAERAFEALKVHKKSIDHHKVDHVRVIATSAFRSATNSFQLVDKVLKELNLKIEVIDGPQEAQFIYHGVKHSGSLEESISLVMDVGGGSCEFIIANQQKAFEFFSFDTGVSRLLEMFRPDDPIQPNQIREIYDYVLKAIQPLIKVSHQYKIEFLVGSSGTFDTFADMIFYETGHQLKKDLCLEYSVAEFQKLYDKIITSNLSERLEMPGMAKFRAEMIVASVIHVKVITDFFKINRIKSSAYSLKEGVIMEPYE